MNEQQRLLSLIWCDDDALIEKSGLDKRAIEIYRRNLQGNAYRALSITFPTIFQLLDSDVSEHLVEQFLKLCPPDQGDWTQWGEEFSDFIAVDQIATHYPYLADCAALDWCVHLALHGHDQTLQQASLALLGELDPQQIVVEFNSNINLLSTTFPIADIYSAHHHPDEQQRHLTLQQAKQALGAPLQPACVMVSRPQFQPQVRQLGDTEAQFMQALTRKKSLSDALDLVADREDFDFQQWLMQAIENNLIYQFKAK